METDSIYLRARYYSPGLGRFTSEDPIRSGGNWYSYCSGNPVMFVDPMGLKDVKLRDYVESLDGADISWDKNTNTATVNYKGVEYKFSSKEYEIKSDNRMYADDKLLDSIFKNKYSGRQINDQASKNIFANRVNGGPGSYIVGNLQIVRKIGELIETFPEYEYSESKDISGQVGEYLIGKIPVGGDIYSIAKITSTLYKNRTIDFVEVGGVYCKSFYTRNIVDPSQSSLNIPVAYDYQYVKVYYSDPELSDPIYVDVEGEGVTKLASNNLR